MKSQLAASLASVLSSLVVAGLPGAAAAQIATAQAAPAPVLPSAEVGAVDPYAWLEDIHGKPALDWVGKQNARTATRLDADPRFEAFRTQTLSILTSTDRIAEPGFLGKGVENFWQDGAHVKGLWRITTPESFARHDPKWRTLLDLDALSKAEGRNWIFKGASCLGPTDRLCLVHLSDGGGDAVEMREFDTVSRRFVSGGFHLSTGKQSVQWLDADTLLVARDWGPGSLTASGYPFVIKRLKRGEALTAAQEVFRGQAGDVRADPTVLRDTTGAVLAVLARRSPAFFSTRWSLLSPDGHATAIDLPERQSVHGHLGTKLIVSLNQAWAAGPGHDAFLAGDLIAHDLKTGHSTLIARPKQTQSFDGVRVTKSRVLVQLLDNVNGAIDAYAPGKTGWSRRRIPLPAGLAVSIRAAAQGSDRAYLGTESFLEPSALWEANARTGAVHRIRSLKPLFDTTRDAVEQHFATSSDGVKIPYFLVRPKDMAGNSATPTIMYGYGGFQLSKPPIYLPEMGKLWLEHGGAYVIANIRGGGEYGPAWHDAVLREKRQLSFDDFAAVARDLIARKVTSPAHLGIYGRSNGGVLTSVSITQHPELFNAAVIESPLVDMLRYNHLSAGASWMAEYGNPDVAEDRAFISAYSAYTQLKPGVKYPEPYITTNTEDDRVHPGHARKFAAALEGLGSPYVYYENTFGGHANNADPELNARRWARHYIYLTQKLMDGDGVAR